VIGTGDFNGDGKSDILWQNTNDGTPAIWEMNGTSIVSAVAIPSPGVGFQLQDDGPIPADQMATGSGTMYLSMPDGVNGMSDPLKLAAQGAGLGRAIQALAG
jgi:hypothetical protein